MPAASLGRFAWQEREGSIGRGIFRLNISDVLSSVLNCALLSSFHKLSCEETAWWLPAVGMA